MRNRFLYSLQTQGLIVLLLSILTTGCTPCWANNSHIDGHSLDQWCDAIHKAEGNDNYGILSVKCTKGEDCRRICINTVRNNYKRWAQAGRKGTYIQFFGKRYCPIGAKNDPNGFNKYWVKNVKYYLERGF